MSKHFWSSAISSEEKSPLFNHNFVKGKKSAWVSVRKWPDQKTSPLLKGFFHWSSNAKLFSSLWRNVMMSGLKQINKKELAMRQCQIRVQFESVGMQFFKVLKKWFWMTKYVPIIVLWCSERGFYKKVTWSPVLGVLPMPQITLQCMCVYWGKLILEKILKVANIDIGFSVCYINEEK